MPTISMFYGIIIRMYCAPKEHKPPHFHVYYGDYKGIVDIETCELIEGDIPKKQLRLTQAWAELHQDELRANWQIAMDSELPFKIEPLK